MVDITSHTDDIDSSKKPRKGQEQEKAEGQVGRFQRHGG